MSDSVTPWTVACQASLSFVFSQSFLKFMSIELVMLSNHLILCHLLLLPSIFPSIRVFSNESDGQSIGASASALDFLMNIQYWFPLGLTCLISLQSKGLSRVSSNITVWKHQFFSTQPSLCSIHSLTSIHDYWKNHSFDKRLFAGKVVSLLFNTLSRFIIALWYLPASCGSSWTTKKMKGKWLHY